MNSSNRMFDPFNDLCPFCLSELRDGAQDNGICGHEKILDEYQHLRFNAKDRLTENEITDSEKRFFAALKTEPAVRGKTHGHI